MKLTPFGFDVEEYHTKYDDVFPYEASRVF